MKKYIYGCCSLLGRGFGDQNAWAIVSGVQYLVPAKSFDSFKVKTSAAKNTDQFFVLLGDTIVDVLSPTAMTCDMNDLQAVYAQLRKAALALFPTLATCTACNRIGTKIAGKTVRCDQCDVAFKDLPHADLVREMERWP